MSIIRILIVWSLVCAASAVSAQNTRVTIAEDITIDDDSWRQSAYWLDVVDGESSPTHVQIVDGSKLNYVSVAGHSRLDVWGGISEGLVSEDQSHIAISGGTFYDGDDAFVVVNDDSNADITGGLFGEASMTANGSSTLNISGGKEIFLVLVYDTATVNLFGTDLAAHLRGESSEGREFFVTGTLSNGDSIATQISLFGNESSMSLHNVPEPAGLAFHGLLVASLYFGMIRRK